MRLVVQGRSQIGLFDQFLPQSDNELLVSKMQKKLPTSCRVTIFMSEIKPVENYPDFEKLALLIQRVIERLILKKVESESKEANDLSQFL